MRCAAIMTADPPTVRDCESVGAAARKLIDHRQLNLPVVDAEGRYVGMFAAEDLLNLVVPRVALAGGLAPNVRFVADDPDSLRERFKSVKQRAVGEVADKNAAVLTPDTPPIDAFRIFCRNRASLAVIDPASRKLLGTLSYWEVMREITAGA